MSISGRPTPSPRAKKRKTSAHSIHEERTKALFTLRSALPAKKSKPALITNKAVENSDGIFPSTSTSNNRLIPKNRGWPSPTRTKITRRFARSSKPAAADKTEATREGVRVILSRALDTFCRGTKSWTLRRSDNLFGSRLFYRRNQSCEQPSHL